MSANYSGAEIVVLLNVVELAKRCGLRPSEADPTITYDVDDVKTPYRMIFVWGSDSPEMDRFRELLGMDDHCEELVAGDLSEFEDRVEKALSLAPRARTR